MSTLKEKAEQILQEKEEKIIPSNFKNTLTIFDVTGNIMDFENVGTGSQFMENDVIYNMGNNEFMVQLYDLFSPGRAILHHTSLQITNIPGERIAAVSNLTPDKLKKGETILGITGTYGGYNTTLNICNNFRLDNDYIIADVEDYMYIGDVNGRILSIASYTDNFDMGGILIINNNINHTPEMLYLYDTDKLLLDDNKLYPCWGVADTQEEANSIISSIKSYIMYFYFNERSWGDDTIGLTIKSVTFDGETKYYVILDGSEYDNTTLFSCYRFKAGGGESVPLTIYTNNYSYIYNF